MSRLIFVLLALAGPAQAAQDMDAAALGAALDKARGEQVDALSPKNFAAAVEAHDAAVKDAAKGRKEDKVRARVQEGEAALGRATAAAAAARQVLGSVIKAREDALTAEAPKFAGEAWTKAAERFREAMTENEQNDAKNAQRRAAEAEVLMREAELIAIKGGILDEARALIAQADEAKVGKLAPRSLQAAKRYLAQADQEIQRNRYDVAQPRKLAAQARYEARHATYLAQLIERVLKEENDDQAGVEGLILSWEEPVKQIAAEMELSAQFDKGMQAPMQEINEHAGQQAVEVSRLKQEVTDRDEQLAALNSQVQRLESRLGGVSEERVALQRRVDVQERMRSSVRALEASFTADEARVTRQGDDVVLSLLGIKFPSGRSTIDSSSAALMKKVQQGLALFPGASVSIEGHTDANGSDSTNLILSQDRADAVRQYLVTNFAMDPEKVTSVGYGEARPVATNETAAGRARNRRIDLVIHPEQR
ncbi:MAG TPA: OmpA family protein [Steroidobacteraceae bacterium]|nr:OmpA family protein [Steroidobacteraceae bacterium]